MKKPLKDSFIIGFALFSMFFGAGNVIFPPYLGLESGPHWLLGFISYYIADIGLALLAMFAILRQGSPEKVTSRIGKVPSVLLMCAIVLCIGPMLAIPRTAATTFETSVTPLVSGVSPVLFSVLFFLLILLLLFGLMGGGIGYLGYAAGAELVSLVQNWEGLLEGLRTVLDQLELISFQLWTLVPPELTESVQSVADGLMDWLNTAVPNILQNAVAFTTEKAKRVPSFGLALIIYVMAAYMLTVDYPELRARAAQHTHERLLRFVVQVRNIALAAFGGYLRAELLLSVGVFFILLVGFFLIGQSYGLLLALGLAMLDFIPIVGAGTIMVPWAFLALFTHDYAQAIQIMLIWGVIAMFRRVGEPKVVGDQTGLSPILSLVSIYVGMRLGGVLGMVLGPTVALIALNLVKLGLFEGLRLDLAAAAEDIMALLRERPEN